MTGVAVFKSITQCRNWILHIHTVHTHLTNCTYCFAYQFYRCSHHQISNADCGAFSQDNLAWCRCSSVHNALSRLLAIVHTLGLSAFLIVRVLRFFDTSLYVTRVLRRWGFDSTNQRRRAREPSLILRLII